MSFSQYLVILTCAVALLNCCEAKFGYALWTDGRPTAVVAERETDPPRPHAARALFHNVMNDTGWSFLELHTRADQSEEKQAYSAGFLEGFLTRDLIWMHWLNMLKGYCINKTDLCSKIDDFIDKQENYLSQKIAKNPGHVYWQQVKLIFIQIEGMAEGYKSATENNNEMLTVRDILWLNMLGSIDDIALSLSPPAPGATPERLLFGAHCSGLVKLTDNDIYVGHATWYSYQSMTRIQKLYSFSWGPKHAFSGYPGLVHSMDDFNVLSSGLVTSETTLAVSNVSLFKLISPVGQVPQFVRSLVANRLAKSGQEWTEIYRKFNSGTYNNQWFIVDYKRYRAGKPEPGTLWVLEQLPGHVEAADLTSLLVSQTYFPSYNIAYFPLVFNTSGGEERVRRYGPWFSYNGNPRAKMFKDLQSSISDPSSMLGVLRYNDYLHDARSRCAACRPPYSASNAIAARGDLNPANGTYPFHALGHRSHGATDAKLTSRKLAELLMFHAVSSPTFSEERGIPPFRWSKFDLASTLSHVGLPDLWAFEPLLHKWEWQ